MKSRLPSENELIVIVLRRSLPAMLRSRLKLGHMSWKGSALRGIGWLHTTNSWSSHIVPLGKDAELTQSQLLCGYLFDIEARTQAFCKAYSSVDSTCTKPLTIVEAQLETLNTVTGVESLFDALGLRMTNSTEALVGQKVNDRHDEKKHAHGRQDLTLAECADEIRDFVEKCKSRGIYLPSPMGT